MRQAWIIVPVDTPAEEIWEKCVHNMGEPVVKFTQGAAQGYIDLFVAKGRRGLYRPRQAELNGIEEDPILAELGGVF